MATSFVKRVARSATSPVRDYINNHFEMVKDEVRQSGAATGALTADGSADGSAWGRLSELESMLAEHSIHQARVLARLSEEVAELAARIDDLERVVRQIAVAIAPTVPE
jgi:hypothetical protein